MALTYVSVKASLTYSLPHIFFRSPALDLVPIRGNIFHDEVVFFHRHSRTLIVADLCISGHPSQPPFTRFVLWLGGVYQKPGPLLDVKLAYLDKRAARSSLEKVMDWDFDKMILSHGQKSEFWC